MIIDFLHALEETDAAVAIAESASLFPWLEVIHVIAISVVLGTIFLVDIRLMGSASIPSRISSLSFKLLPLTWCAFAVAVISGAFLFLSQPVNYFGNFAFRLKMFMLLMAGLNMGVFHLVIQRTMDIWDNDVIPPKGARIAGALSIMIWMTVVCAGRWIGFTLS